MKSFISSLGPDTLLGWASETHAGLKWNLSVWPVDLNGRLIWMTAFYDLLLFARSLPTHIIACLSVCVCVCLSSASPSVFHPSPFSSCLHVLSLSFPRCYPLCFFKVVLVPINSSIFPAVHSGLFLVTLWDLEEKQIQGTMFGWLLKISASHGQVIIWCDPSEPISRALFRFIYFTLCFCSNCSYLQPQIWVQNLVHY